MGKSVVKSADADAQVQPAPKRTAARKLGPGALSRYAFLIAATLVALVAFVLLWQSWLVFAERGNAEQLDAVLNADATALGTLLADTRSRVEKAAATPAVVDALAEGESGRPAAAAALKQVLPELVTVDFYRGDLGEVLGSDFSKFGYARSALLLRASHLHSITPAQVQGVESKRALAYALPIVRDKQTLAYVYLTMPFEPALAAFRRPLDAGRIDLRQGPGSGDLILASIGANSIGNSLGDSGASVPDSLFRLGRVPPQPLIFLPRNLWLLIPLALLVLFIGATMFYARVVGWRVALDRMLQRHGRAAAYEPTLAEATAIADQERALLPVPVAPAKQAEAAVRPASLAVDRSIFRTYDIRGVLGKSLNAEVARLIGRAIGSEMAARGLAAIAVGRDGRLSGPELSAALIEGLRAAGANVTDIGLAPTPLLYFAAYHLDIGSGVSVTGSHNPPDYNGFKVVLGGETLSEGAIQKLYTRIVEQDLTSGSGSLTSRDVTRDYIDRISGDVQMQRKLKVVIDCGNGVAGAIAPELFASIGAEVEPLFCEVDGNFPNHHPDPSDLRNLKDLIMSVKQLKADIGLAFDGDGDRLGVVTANGEVIFPDRVLMLFAKDVLSRNPGATIIYDVKCTGKLQQMILQNAGSPIMWRTGHSLIKAKMRETDAALAGEMSGHFFFKERWYGFDDGLYAGARLLEILGSDFEVRTPQEVFDELPKGVSTPELKIEMQEGEHYAFIERFQQAAKFDGARLITIDGVRADWPDGWGLVRASNTTPALVLRFDADSATALARIQNEFRAQILAINPKLALPF
ncbi:MAG: phosphomannomutase/phosphoglucomutase [Rudaea sp.]